MNKHIKDIFIKIGKRFYELDERLHIQQLDNGFIMSNRYYKTIDEFIPDLAKELKNYFKN